jgi:hypothetical protein
LNAQRNIAVCHLTFASILLVDIWLKVNFREIKTKSQKTFTSSLCFAFMKGGHPSSAASSCSLRSPFRPDRN